MLVNETPLHPMQSTIADLNYRIIFQCKLFFLFIGRLIPPCVPTNNGLFMRNVVQLCLAANNIDFVIKTTDQLFTSAFGLGK